MASKTSTMGTTLRVLETLVKRWPSAGGKDGRSLAERLTSAYLARMNEGFSKDTESVCYNIFFINSFYFFKFFIVFFNFFNDGSLHASIRYNGCNTAMYATHFRDIF